jgi:hypothetical protein
MTLLKPVVFSDRDPALIQLPFNRFKMPTTRVPLVLGTMTFATDESARIRDPAVVQQIVDSFKHHGHSQLDTARLYGSGTSPRCVGLSNLPHNLHSGGDARQPQVGRHHH